MPSRNSKLVRRGGQSPHFLSVSGLQLTTDRWTRPGPQRAQVIRQGQSDSRWNRNTLSPSTPSKNHPGKKRETPHKTMREGAVGPVSILSPRSPPPVRSRESQRLPRKSQSVRGELARTAECCPPKLLLCPPLCHKRHLTPHHRKGVCSALLWRPDEATKTELRGAQRHRVLPGLSDGQATYLRPAEPAVPTESSRLSGLWGSDF